MHDALILEEREEEIEETEPQQEQEELEIGLEALADKYGLEKIKDAFARISKKE
jgi:benzoyl-CoA reductase subunit BamC